MLSDVRLVWSSDFIRWSAGGMVTANQRNLQTSGTGTNDGLDLSRSTSSILNSSIGFSSFERLRTLAGILWCYFVVEPAYANSRSAMLCCCRCFRLRANRSRCLPKLLGLFCSHFFFCSLLHCLQYVFLPSFLVLST